MNSGSRDKLWDAVFETYYDSYFEELKADALVSMWQYFDAVVNILVSVTASGSVVAGWALWDNPDFKTTWALIAGAGALFSIIHTTLTVPQKLKEHGQSQVLFAVLRSELETFRHRMNIDPDFPVEEYKEEYLKFRVRFTKALQTNRQDLFFTNKRANKIQDTLNLKLTHEIEE